jgi:GTP pyrophosphokinase
LPKGATAVDFAYAVHSKIGQKCCGVRINGKNRQLATELENGDQIDIITKATARPLAEWENFVKTGRAKSGIRRAVRAERAVEFSRVGKSILQKAFSEVNKPLKKRAMDKIPQIFGVQKPEDLFALVGEGRMQPELVIKKMFPDLAKSKKTRQANR